MVIIIDEIFGTVTTVETLSTTYANETLYNLKTSQANEFSGNANNAAQGTAANQPTVIQSGINGLPALGFSLTGLLVSPAAPANSNIWATGGTLIVVYNARTLSSNARVCSKEPISGGGWVLFNQQSSSHKLQLDVQFSEGTQSWILANTDNPASTNLIVAITYDGSSSSNNPSFYINSLTSKAIINTSRPGGTIGNDSAIQFNIGNHSSGISPLNGLVSKIMMWKRILPINELSIVMKTLGAKYEVTIL